MDYAEFILGSYLVTGVLVLWLILSTWLDARRVNRALKQQDTHPSQ